MKKMKNALNEYIHIPSGAVRAYENLGYTVVESPKDRRKGNKKDNQKSEDDIFLEEAVQRPIGEWSKKDIARFLKLKGKETMLKNEDGTNKSFEEGKQIVLKIINSEE